TILCEDTKVLLDGRLLDHKILAGLWARSSGMCRIGGRHRRRREREPVDNQ
ncbi:hypothetical protein TcasGA2_TC035014, partial [Tribolium castaneum]